MTTTQTLDVQPAEPNPLGCEADPAVPLHHFTSVGPTGTARSTQAYCLHCKSWFFPAQDWDCHTRRRQALASGRS